MGRRSKRKGDEGEHEVATIITVELALPADAVRRGDQSWGAHHEPDVVGIDGWWCEVKRKQRPSFGAWLLALLKHIQAARSQSKPLLVWRRDRGTWWAVLRLVDWCALVRERDHLRAENDRLRAALALPSRTVQPDPGPRQRTLDEVM